MKQTTTSRAEVLALAVALIVASVACSKASPKATPLSGSAGASGVIKVCSDIPYKPMEYVGAGPRGLGYTGFDIELLDAMAQRLGRKISVDNVKFNKIFGALAAGRCDVVGSSATITAARAKSMLFTAPYFDDDQSLLVRSGSHVTNLAGLAGKTIGVQTHNRGQAYVSAHQPSRATVKEFADSAGLFGALAAGTIDGIVQDLPLNAGRATEDKTVKVVQTFRGHEQYGFAVAEGQTRLLADLNRALAKTRSDGTYQSLYDKYFPKPAS